MEDMKCKDLMRKIQELEFTAVDLNLFLDNHPSNRQALMYYNNTVRDLTELKKEYEMNYGPLTNFGYAPSQCPWKWVDEPWPWEMKE